MYPVPQAASTGEIQGQVCLVPQILILGFHTRSVLTP